MSLASRNMGGGIKAAALVLAGGAVLAAVVPGGTAAAQSIVVRSTGPSATQYPQGRKLPADASVTLKAGDKLTVLDKSGTRVLSGPGSFTLNGAVVRSGGASLAAMVNSGNSRVRTGAVRGAASVRSATSPDSIWQVDVTKSGIYCIADPSSVVLWRPNRSESAVGKITGKGKTASIRWGAGSALRLWPAGDIPVVDGQVYTFSDPVGPSVQFTFHKLDTVPEDQLAVASLLAEKGCSVQLDMIATAAAAVSGSSQ